jgi:hypothetical protein
LAYFLATAPAPQAVSLLSKGTQFYDQLNSPLLVLELFFIHLNVCGRFWGKIGEFGRNRLKKGTLPTGYPAPSPVFFSVAAQNKKKDDHSYSKVSK